MNSDNLKLCKSCNMVLRKDHFYLASKKLGYLRSDCMACKRAKSNQNRRK